MRNKILPNVGLIYGTKYCYMLKRKRRPRRVEEGRNVETERVQTNIGVTQ